MIWGLCLTGGSDHIEFLQKKNPGGNSLIIHRQCSNVLLFEGLTESLHSPCLEGAYNPEGKLRQIFQRRSLRR